MKDSFNNELQVGDRILCVEPNICNRHRRNQIGTVARINWDRAIVKFDLPHGRGWGYPELNIRPNRGNCMILDEDVFIKLETHTEVEYRKGDKVLCYYTTVSNYPFVGTVVQDKNDEKYIVLDKEGNRYILTNSEILFLLTRTQYKVGDEVVIQKKVYNDFFFAEGYNQSIPTRIHEIDTSRINALGGFDIRIEMDDTTIGWERKNEPNHSYWILKNTDTLFPKEFSYSLPLVEYLEFHQISNSIEQINPTKENRTASKKPAPKLIHNYNYKPAKMHFYSKEKEDINKNNLYLGIELEISGSSKDSDSEEDAKEIVKVFKETLVNKKAPIEDVVYFKHDGSINGFEIVFHPHTVKAYHEYNWKKFFSTIKRLGYTNDDSKAGFHIHISRSYFRDESQQNEALAKLVFLMYKFKTEIEPLAGRKDSDYATYSAKALKRVKENDFLGTFRWYCDSCGKYSAINCQHEDTFEIRIFDGVTDKVRLIDILNLVENLCVIVKCTSITDITKVRLEDFMPFLYSIER